MALHFAKFLIRLTTYIRITGHIAHRAHAQFENWLTVSLTHIPDDENMEDHILSMLIESMDARKRIWQDILRRHGCESGNENFII